MLDFGSRINHELMAVLTANTKSLVPLKFLETVDAQLSDRLTGLTSQHAMLLTLLFDTIQKDQKQKPNNGTGQDLDDLGDLSFVEIGGGFASMVRQRYTCNTSYPYAIAFDTCRCLVVVVLVAKYRC
jgi:hypothetical protein